METVIPSEVLELLSERVYSLEQLDVLLLLHGKRDRGWQLAELALALGESRDMVTEALRALLAGGLVATRDEGPQCRWYYRPISARLDEHVGLLAILCKEQRVEIIRLMLSYSLKRIRGVVALAFPETAASGADDPMPTRKQPR